MHKNMPKCALSIFCYCPMICRFSLCPARYIDFSKTVLSFRPRGLWPGPSRTPMGH